MRELTHSLHQFVEALHRGDPVYLASNGRWKTENRALKLVRKLTGSETYANIDLLRAFIKALDTCEAHPVNFSKIPGVVVSQPIDFLGFITAAQAVRHYVESDTPHPALKSLLDDLKIRTLGLLYRLEEENGGLHKAEVDPECLQKLTELASKWKKEQKIFWFTELKEGEVKQLERACRYREFLRYLLADVKLREDFFGWILRDGLPVDPYIQFPALREKLTASNLRGRMGRMGHGYLKLRKIDSPESLHCLQKHLLLPFEGQDISILDENREIVFRGNYKVTLKQLYNVFRNKLKDLGNFEVFAQGIMNWNSHCWGWWNNDIRAYELVDLDQPDWWRQLPVLEILTIEEASKRFSVNLDGRKWSLAAKSARESVTLDYDLCHAYIEMAIPTPDHQFYVIYTFGKAAIDLPQNSFHRIFLFGAHVPATIVYPDETMFFTHRQQIGYSFELTEDEGQRLMAAFKEDIQRARAGNMVFQIEAENCGKWIQTHLEEHLGRERVPNLYRFPLLEAEPTGFMNNFFQFFKNMPRFCRNRLFILIHYPLGAWRGRWVIDKSGQKVWKSLLNSAFWKDAITYLPTYLHRQHEIGVFSEDPKRHKVWVEPSQAAQKGTEVPPSQQEANTHLFEENS